MKQNTIKDWLVNVIDAGDISLKTIANALDIPYEAFRRTSVRPTPGEVYDPSKLNVDAMSTYIEKAYQGAPASLPLLEDLPSRAIANTADLKDFTVGTKVTFKRNIRGKYIVHHIHGMYIILLPEKEFDKPRVINGDTFIHQGPVKED